MSAVLQLLLKGGPITGVIALLGVVAAFLICERYLHLHRAQINVAEFLRGIINVCRRGNALEAISLCDDTPGPVAQIVRAALLHGDRSEAERLQAIHEASLAEIPRLEKHLRLLISVAHLAPLLGLLGTVIGMITLFQQMEQSPGFYDVRMMAGSIWQALLSTAAGLCVAAPAYGFYNHFHGMIEDLLVDMEKAASEILHFLRDHPLPAGAVPLPGEGPTPVEEAAAAVGESTEQPGATPAKATATADAGASPHAAKPPRPAHPERRSTAS